jgi:hypothetical protein
VRKIGQFIYSWGNGHYSRMMRFDEEFSMLVNGVETHYCSKDEIYKKLLRRFPDKKQYIHEMRMPTPIDGRYGPSVFLSTLNFLLPIRGNPPLVTQVSSYLKKEAKLFDTVGFDLVINDGDMGPNILARNRGVKSIFVTNQFKPRLWKSHFFFYPGMQFIAKQIAKATKIIVADSPPPYAICEYNLNFPESLKEKIVYAGHFAQSKKQPSTEKTDLERLLEGNEFGYWMRTGNKSTNEVTGKKYEQVFSSEQMKNEKRIISHATADPSIDRVIGTDGRKYSIAEALERKIDWIQVDVGFLTEQQKETTLELCKYAVVNGSHTVMGEIIGVKGKPIIGIPVYDEQGNQIQWAEEHNLGLGAKSTKQVISSIFHLKRNYGEFEEAVSKFQKNFVPDGAKTTAKIAAQMLEEKA